MGWSQTFALKSQMVKPQQLLVATNMPFRGLRLQMEYRCAYTCCTNATVAARASVVVKVERRAWQACLLKRDFGLQNRPCFMQMRHGLPGRHALHQALLQSWRARSAVLSFGEVLHACKTRQTWLSEAADHARVPHHPNRASTAGVSCVLPSVCVHVASEWMRSVCGGSAVRCTFCMPVPSQSSLL